MEKNDYIRFGKGRDDDDGDNGITVVAQGNNIGDIVQGERVHYL